MKYLVFLLIVSSASATEIYPVDRQGQQEYHKNHYEIRDNKVVEATPTGKVEYHKQQYIIKDSKMVPVDRSGNVQYHKSSGKSK